MSGFLSIHECLDTAAIFRVKSSAAGNRESVSWLREMPPWKIVMLDEADMMTPDAQAALRRIMEAFARNTRFIIICNYVHKSVPTTASTMIRWFSFVAGPEGPH